MSQYLPTGNFKWMTDKEISKTNLRKYELDSKEGLILEVDLEYPKELHDLRNDHPIAPEKVNPLRAAVEKSRQCGTSSSHGGRENSTEKHQPVSEGISWEPRIVSSHTAPQKIAKKISFQVTENDMMVA